MIRRPGVLLLSESRRAGYLRGVIYTVGHSTRSIEALVALLAAHRVGLVVDVRRYPASRRHPHFAEQPLAAALHAAGIGYRHEPDLGGRPPARPGPPHTARGRAAVPRPPGPNEKPPLPAGPGRVLC